MPFSCCWYYRQFQVDRARRIVRERCPAGTKLLDSGQWSSLDCHWTGMDWDGLTMEIWKVIILTIGQRWVGMDLLPASDLSSTCPMSQLVHQYPLESWHPLDYSNVQWIWMDSDAHDSDQCLPAILSGPQWPAVSPPIVLWPNEIKIWKRLQNHINRALSWTTIENSLSDKSSTKLPIQLSWPKMDSGFQQDQYIN